MCVVFVSQEYIVLILLSSTIYCINISWMVGLHDLMCVVCFPGVHRINFTQLYHILYIAYISCMVGLLDLVCVVFVSQEYIVHVDPVGQLGLNCDSVLGYSIGEVHRDSGAETPELLPCGYLVGDSDTIAVKLKGAFDNNNT